ncbi:975_t:CDS:2 [Diversispora eburnea]|uniref:975_t:CDS:1 n=1 Tax=Diversispora eburnea TaxID=1213867 RepID=A0A9N8W8Q5_9GLOM|nr:975_t:CDS:2 [Diversispora eburnea]
MTDKLPPNLLALFAPRPPLPYSKPLDRDPAKRRGPTITGLGSYAPSLSDYDPNYVPTETVEEKKKRKLEEKKQKAEEAVKKGLEEWEPNKDDNVTGDPFKTLFVARMSYEMTEKDLRREFEMYGPIESIRIVKNKANGKPRGYAFVEFEREKDMKAAYKDADGVKLLGRRILVDVERGRTVKGWRPRRLGGGLGGTRIGGPDQNQKYSGREGSYALHTTHPPPSVGYDRDYRSNYRGATPVTSIEDVGADREVLEEMIGIQEIEGGIADNQICLSVIRRVVFNSVLSLLSYKPIHLTVLGQDSQPKTRFLSVKFRK